MSLSMRAALFAADFDLPLAVHAGPLTLDDIIQRVINASPQGNLIDHTHAGRFACTLPHDPRPPCS